jgi:hypothetical protein
LLLWDNTLLQERKEAIRAIARTQAAATMLDESFEKENAHAFQVF